MQNISIGRYVLGLKSKVTTNCVISWQFIVALIKLKPTEKRKTLHAHRNKVRCVAPHLPPVVNQSLATDQERSWVLADHRMNDITVARFGKRLTLSKAANCLVTSFHWSLDAHQPVRLCQPIDNAKLGTYMIRVTDLHDTPSNRQTHHIKRSFWPCIHAIITWKHLTSKRRRSNVVLTQRRWQFSKTSFLDRKHRFEVERCLPDSSGFLLD